jgi:hypothetical protein
MYPDEYDVYDQAAETSMKKNYAGKKILDGGPSA